MSRSRTPRGRRGCCGPVLARVLALAIVLTPTIGCASDETARGGPMSRGQADREIRKGIRSSSEGIILMPSRKAESQYDIVRLNELAQALRQPAAMCFIERAIATMERDPSSERGYRGVPDGQVKLRVRLAPSGEVMRAEVLESGFADPVVPECFTRAVQRTHWPENRSGVMHHVDVIWWVSLGSQAEFESPEFQQHLRRQAAEVSVRAKRCLQGRIGTGAFEIEGLNLVLSDGASITSRVIEDALPETVRGCVARALRDLRLPQRSDAFIRPVSTTLRFVIDEEGDVLAEDEEWLRLVKLEERARRAEQRAALLGDPDDAPPQDGQGDGLADAERVDQPEPEDDDGETLEPPPKPSLDPGRGGLKLDLGVRVRDEER